MTDYIELGKRLVACEGFRWTPGMYAQRITHSGEFTGVRFFGNVDSSPEAASVSVVTDRQGVRLVESGHVVVDGWFREDTLIPDLSDAATKGCVLQLVRKRWEDSHFHVWHSRQLDGWVWVARGQVCSVYGSADIFPSELEAMVDAMEAAP